MGCYFIVSVRIERPERRALYEEYICLVKPLVESFGGEYLVRSENLEYAGGDWRPDRLIVIRFPDRGALDRCFRSPEYEKIKNLRIESVAASVVIAEGR
ncbi:hypothetical protein SDC9_131310 [bioreactor metagenome]|uniref:DUF1330 domain-containing protein n=1 Tax=bioreactor metagenome TaxID=1076179 RepID=A0A645D4U6_9ZZZZ